MKKRENNITLFTILGYIYIYVYSSNLLASLSGIIALGFGDAAVSFFVLWVYVLSVKKMAKKTYSNDLLLLLW